MISGMPCHTRFKSYHEGFSSRPGLFPADIGGAPGMVHGVIRSAASCAEPRGAGMVRREGRGDAEDRAMGAQRSFRLGIRSAGRLDLSEYLMDASFRTVSNTNSGELSEVVDSDVNGHLRYPGLRIQITHDGDGMRRMLPGSWRSSSREKGFNANCPEMRLLAHRPHRLPADGTDSDMRDG